MKKLFSMMLVAAMLICCMASVAIASEPGDTVTIAFTTNDNPGFATFGAVINYDSAVLELTEIKRGELCGSGLFDGNIPTAKVAFAGAEDVKENGILFTATFKIKEEAAPGTYAVSATLDVNSTANANYELVVFSINGGNVVVDEPVCEHEYQGVVTKAATCEDAGVMTYTCAKCGESYEEAIPATGHAYGEWTVTKAATCEETGIESRVCANDASHVETREIAATGHAYGEWTVTKAATCEETGIETRVCANDASHVETREIPKAEHELEWAHDEKDHWQVCKNCGFVSEKEAHEFENNGYCKCGYKKPAEPDDPGLDDVPQTGDITPVILLGMFGMIAVVGAAAVVIKRKNVR